MLRTGAELAAWLDLASFANVASEPAEVFVIHMLNIVDAELADLAARGETSAASTATRSASARSTTTSGTATWASATAFATFTSLALRATETGTLWSFASLFVAILIVTHCLNSP